MLFDSSIRKELAKSFIATLVVMVTVVMSMMLIRMLGSASRGSVDPRDVILLMGYSVLGHLPTILTLSLFIAVTNTLSRMYRDSEMAVWFSSGNGLLQFAAPLYRFAWPVLLTIFVLAVWVWPWANQQTAKMRVQYEQRGDIERIAPGKFQENASGSRVFFMEAGSLAPSLPKTVAGDKTQSLAVSGDARNVFLSQREKTKTTISTAQQGKLEIIGGDPFLVLQQGQRLDRSEGSTNLRITQFESFGNIVKNPAARAQEPAAKTLPSLQLLQSPSPINHAELAWRLGLVLCAMNLLLLALALTAVNPRAGKSMGLALALLAFVVYYNMLNVGYSRIASGKSAIAPWMLALHGGILIFSMAWLTLRHKQWSWRHLLRAKTTSLPQGAHA